MAGTPRRPSRSRMPSAITCSPYMPRPRLAAVIPSCAVAMYRSCWVGFFRTRCTAFAIALPAAARRSIAIRGAPTIANSAATNSAVEEDERGDDQERDHRSASIAGGRGPTMIAWTTPPSTTSTSISTPSSVSRSPRPGHASQPVREVGADRLGCPLPVAADQERGVIEPHQTRHPEPAVRQPDRAQLRRLEFVGDASEQLADDVFEGDQSDDGLAIVHDQRLVAAPLAEETEQSIRGHGVRHADDGPQQRGHAHGSAPRVLRDDVLRVQDADDAAHRAAIDREPAERARRDDAQDLVERRRAFDARKPRTRDHQLACRAQAEPQGPVEPHLFERFQQAAVAAFGNQQLDFLRGVHVPVSRRGHAKEPEQQDTGAVQQRDGAREDAKRPLHRQDGEERRLGRLGEGERLRHQLAGDDRQGGQEEQHGERRGRVRGVGIDAAEALDPRAEGRGERRLTVRAQDQARQGNADLRRGDVPIEGVAVFDDRQEACRERVAVLGQSPQAAAADAHGGKFSRDVQGREQNQQDDDRPRQEHVRGIVPQNTAEPSSPLSLTRTRAAGTLDPPLRRARTNPDQP